MSAPRHPLSVPSWLVPLAIVTVAFLAFSLPPYLGLDPSAARVQLRASHPVQYPLLVTHIFLGSIVLLTACLQVWPWLRRHHPAVHRLSGRVYVWFAIPTGLLSVIVSALSLMGLNFQAATVLLSLVWLATTINGYRTARHQKFAEHREWMIRSVALVFAVVVNRLWMPLCILVFAPNETRAELEQAAGLSLWLSWVINLLIAEWWLHYTRNRRHASPTAIQHRDKTSTTV